jgi:hypothetical protein
MEKLKLGWREWLSLPLLGVPHIKAKIDTGARTSALHATKMRVVRRGDKRFVRFHTHPIQKNNEISIECLAPLVDRRFVTDSGGSKELRYIIQMPLQINGKKWEAEVSLTNRKKMRFRMLLGRTALKNCEIHPDASYLCGKVLRSKLKKDYSA